MSIRNLKRFVQDGKCLIQDKKLFIQNKKSCLSDIEISFFHQNQYPFDSHLSPFRIASANPPPFLIIPSATEKCFPQNLMSGFENIFRQCILLS